MVGMGYKMCKWWVVFGKGLNPFSVGSRDGDEKGDGKSG
jgi:hypothetical protein